MAHLYIVARLRGEVANGCHGGDARSLVAVHSRYPVVHPPVGKNNGVCRHTGVFTGGCVATSKGRWLCEKLMCLLTIRRENVQVSSMHKVMRKNIRVGSIARARWPCNANQGRVVVYESCNER